jgi:hypothetical protein
VSLASYRLDQVSLASYRLDQVSLVSYRLDQASLVSYRLDQASLVSYRLNQASLVSYRLDQASKPSTFKTHSYFSSQQTSCLKHRNIVEFQKVYIGLEKVIFFLRNLRFEIISVFLAIKPGAQEEYIQIIFSFSHAWLLV